MNLITLGGSLALQHFCVSVSCSLLSPVRLDFLRACQAGNVLSGGPRIQKMAWKRVVQRWDYVFAACSWRAWRLENWGFEQTLPNGQKAQSEFLQQAVLLLIPAWISAFFLPVHLFIFVLLGFTWISHDLSSRWLACQRPGLDFRMWWLNGWTSWYFFSFVGCSQKIHKALGWGHWRTWNEIRLSKLSYRIACLNASNRWYRWAYAYACT